MFTYSSNCNDIIYITVLNYIKDNKNNTDLITQSIYSSKQSKIVQSDSDSAF